MSFPAFSIRNKLIASFALLTGFLVGLGVLGLFSMGVLRDQALSIERNWLPSVRALGEIDTLSARMNGVMLRHTQATEPQMLAGMEKDFERFGGKIAERQALYQTLIASPEEQALYDGYRAQLAVFEAERAKVLDLSRAGKKAEAFATTNPRVSRRAARCRTPWRS